MTPMTKYNIPIGGLALGEHQFNYLIDGSFFKNLEYCEIEEGNVAMQVRAEKQVSMMVVEFDQKGTIKLCCDRCGDFYNYSVDAKNQLVIKFNTGDFDETDDVVIMNDSDNRLDLTHYFYEYIYLQIPLKRLHDKAGCNPKALKKLKELQGLHNDPSYVDPRWEGLKSSIK
jgi:uncharacterized metal-binding protein YceD (DUF177 family)